MLSNSALDLPGSKMQKSIILFQLGISSTCITFVIRFKEALSTAVVNPTRFTDHSFWIGAATTAAKKGLPDSTIKRLGWRKNSAQQRYIKPSPTTLKKMETTPSSISTPHQHLDDPLLFSKL